MKSAQDRDLSSLTLDELMADLEAVDQPARANVETWLNLDGWHPGSTRMAAADLYAKYVEWLTHHPDLGPPLALRVWGKFMTSRFKKTRGAVGYSYYMSRESLSDLRRKLR